MFFGLPAACAQSEKTKTNPDPAKSTRRLTTVFQISVAGEARMQIHRLSRQDALKALGIGVLTAVLLSAIMVPAFKLGIAPLPEPPSLAFAKLLLGANTPLPVGLLFHVAYVTIWSVVFVSVFRDRLTFLNALWLGLALWIVILVFFFPLLGWGFFGLAISPKLIPASLVPHVLFAVFLWGLCRWGFKMKTVPGE
jgi:hypothetical protein